ncbi:hypothetical protein [Vibrio sp. WXL210]|uniref:hypothetical protein n=1 Tax=Vibrio sp. WXL210 TaxID=3450709 RepID=UPI003EC7A682
MPPNEPTVFWRAEGNIYANVEEDILTVYQANSVGQYCSFVSQTEHWYVISGDLDQDQVEIRYINADGYPALAEFSKTNVHPEYMYPECNEVHPLNGVYTRLSGTFQSDYLVIAAPETYALTWNEDVQCYEQAIIDAWQRESAFAIKGESGFRARIGAGKSAEFVKYHRLDNLPTHDICL